MAGPFIVGLEQPKSITTNMARQQDMIIIPYGPGPENNYVEFTSDLKSLVAAWLPGTEGEGVVDVLFGDAAFTGKLPRPWPADNSELSAQYPAAHPLFPLRFSLTY